MKGETTMELDTREMDDVAQTSLAVEPTRSFGEVDAYSERDAVASPALWGLLSSIDIYECDPETIRDADQIKTFVIELCDLIEMKRFGDPVVVHFGEDERVAGYSLVQLIETSLISAHFANQTNAVYLDVFSCKLYDPEEVETFSRTFFGGKRSVKHVQERY